MDNTLRECPHCGKVITGTANLIRHEKTCKPKFCSKCKHAGQCRKKDFFLECDELKDLNKR